LIRTLKSQRKEQNEALLSSSTETCRLANEIVKFQGTVENLQDQLNLTNETLIECQNENLSLKGKVDELQVERTALSRSVVEKDELIASLSLEKQQLGSKLEVQKVEQEKTLTAVNQKIMQLVSSDLSIETSLRDERLSTYNLNFSVDELQLALDSLSSQLRNAEESSRCRELDAAEARENAASTKKLLDDAYSALAEAEAARVEMQERHSAKLVEQQSTISTLHDDLSRLREEIASVKQVSEQNVTKAEIEICKLRESLQASQEAIKSQENLERVCDELRKELSYSQSKLTEWATVGNPDFFLT